MAVGKKPVRLDLLPDDQVEALVTFLRGEVERIARELDAAVEVWEARRRRKEGQNGG